MINTMKKKDWIESWRAVRLGKVVWYNQWTRGTADMAAFLALLTRRRLDSPPPPLAERLAHFKTLKKFAYLNKQ
jgi:hypothetical protein